jgi:hypothetical protein
MQIDDRNSVSEDVVHKLVQEYQTRDNVFHSKFLNDVIFLADAGEN